MTVSYEDARAKLEQGLNEAWLRGAGNASVSLPVAVAQALLSGPPEPSEPDAWICDGCGRLAKDPDADLATMRAAGAVSCCPERHVQALYRSRNDG